MDPNLESLQEFQPVPILVMGDKSLFLIIREKLKNRIDLVLENGYTTPD